ncbi:C45 family peptidase [Rhodobacteraceae bacterium D3-12]|nr:C45 family peptidase [Rhodobacteraceae bacterium D3-12]
MSDLPFLDLGDDPTEAGLMQGRALAAAVRNNLETYFARFALGGSDRQTVLAEAERWAAYIAKDNPHYFAEMAGIARGAGLSDTELAVLNARYEITYSLYSREAAAMNGTADFPEQEGCTLWGAMPETTKSGACMIGQNWDWLEKLLGQVVIKRVTRNATPGTGRPDYIGFTEAGIVGCKMGVNAAGIGLCIAGLVSESEGGEQLRKPLHVRCAEILDAWRFSEAIRPVVQTDRLCSSNFMIGHGDGEIINIEATQDRCAYLYPDNGVISHANHLEVETSLRSEFERITPSSLFRAKRVRRHLGAAHGNIDLEVVHKTMSDHFSYPSSVCLHPDPALPAAKRNATVTSVAIDLTNRVLWATDGPPCQGAFQRFDLSGATARRDPVEA